MIPATDVKRWSLVGQRKIGFKLENVEGVQSASNIDDKH